MDSVFVNREIFVIDKITSNEYWQIYWWNCSNLNFEEFTRVSQFLSSFLSWPSFILKASFVISSLIRNLKTIKINNKKIVKLRSKCILDLLSQCIYVRYFLMSFGCFGSIIYLCALREGNQLMIVSYGCVRLTLCREKDQL